MCYFSTISVYSDRATWSKYDVKAIKKQFSHWKLKFFFVYSYFFYMATRSKFIFILHKTAYEK